MSRVFALLLLLALSLTPLLKGKVTKHFHPSKLHVPLPYHSEWEVPSSSAALFSQPFHFLAHGSQTYVFESADGKTVLKLFRYNRSRFSFLHSLKTLFHGKKKADLFTKLNKTFQAYALALQHLPDHTGLLFLHLNPTKNALPAIDVEDHLGRKWHLPLDSYRFIVQKKAEPLKEAFLAALEQKDDGRIKHLIDSFLEGLQERVARGIRNSDHNLGPNFGILDGKVVEIDCGNFHLDPTLSKPDRQQEEIARFSRQLGGWLGVRSPNHEQYLRDKL